VVYFSLQSFLDLKVLGTNECVIQERDNMRDGCMCGYFPKVDLQEQLASLGKTHVSQGAGWFISLFSCSWIKCAGEERE